MKHLAWIAWRESTGRKQEDPLKHRARTVLRTRPRLLRAVLEPPALAKQVTVATPAQEHAQCVYQASTNLQQAMVIARTAARACTGILQDKPLSHPAWRVTRESIGRHLVSAQ